MKQSDAREFIMAMNAIQMYVPPMYFSAITNNPIVAEIQQVANAQPTTERTDNVEPFKKPGDV